MKLSISNLAWPVADDTVVAKILNRYAIDNIDVVPGKYFSSLPTVTDSAIADVKNWWAARGITITGMQSLLFGTVNLNVFGSAEIQAVMLEHLSVICRIGAELGGRRLVFGSPKNRDRRGLSDQDAMNIATDFFERLAIIAQKHDVIVCLEPNPECYGANFMTTSAETAAVVRQINHSNLRMQLDTGAMTINHENPQDVFSTVANFIGHVHVSEPNLVPLGDGETDHKIMGALIHKYLPGHVVTIEMATPKNEPPIDAIERAIIHAQLHYATNHKLRSE